MRYSIWFFTGFLVLATYRAEASILVLRGNLRPAIEIEGGVFSQGRNDAAVPGDSGTHFSLVGLTRPSGGWFRAEAVVPLGRRHELRAVYAPLSVSGSGVLISPVDFNGGRYAENSTVDATYQFNSYRLTYRYALVLTNTWCVMAGVTAKIRDAKIALALNGITSESVNLGFVPLIHFAASARLNYWWSLELEADALVAPQGRAEDVSLRARYLFADSGWSASAGYRLLEGGADNAKVYSFALIHYGLVSLGYAFK